MAGLSARAEPITDDNEVPERSGASQPCIFVRALLLDMQRASNRSPKMERFHTILDGHSELEVVQVGRLDGDGLIGINTA